jgi:hypothetical protein
MCEADVIGKCGSIVTHHWAHMSRPDCDDWAAESEWHIAWKQALHDIFGADIEVPMERNGEKHRADAVVGDGLVVELQASYLPAAAIEAREAFYGRMIWVYDGALFADRIHWGRRGFWIKHGPKSLAGHQRPLFVSSPSTRRFLHVTSLSVVDGRMLGRGRRMDANTFLDRVRRMSGIQEIAA